MKNSCFVLAFLAIIVDVTPGELIPGKIQAPRVKLESVHHVQSLTKLDGAALQGTPQATHVRTARHGHHHHHGNDKKKHKDYTGFDPVSLKMIKIIQLTRKRLMYAGFQPDQIRPLLHKAFFSAIAEAKSMYPKMFTKETTAPVKKKPSEERTRRGIEPFPRNQLASRAPSGSRPISRSTRSILRTTRSISRNLPDRGAEFRQIITEL